MKTILEYIRDFTKNHTEINTSAQFITVSKNEGVGQKKNQVIFWDMKDADLMGYEKADGVPELNKLSVGESATIDRYANGTYEETYVMRIR